MKKIQVFISALVLLSLTTATNGQNIKDIIITDYAMELRGGHLDIGISFDMSNLNLKTTQVLVLTPCIINGTDSLMLRSIGIYGRNRHIFYQRNPEDKPTRDVDQIMKESKTPAVIDYKESVGFAQWMYGCRLAVMRTEYSCCGKTDYRSLTNLVDRFPLDRYVPRLIYLRPIHEITKTRKISGSAYIDFPVGDIVISPDFRNNRSELAKITGLIDPVQNDADISINSIDIKGYASPEGSYANNEHLAKGRTEALKNYVADLYHFNEHLITTSYEPEDWVGLENYVQASDLPHRDEILEVIQSGREPDVIEWIIKSRWKEDYRYLLQNCYPSLRRSDYTIEYTIKSYSDPQEIEMIYKTTPQKLSLEEFYILAKTYKADSEEFNELFETAVRMYPNDPVANLNAANSAILKKDYQRALRYLEKAQSLPETLYARGILEVFMDNEEAAIPYLDQAKRLGIHQAETVLDELSANKTVNKVTNNLYNKQSNN